MKKFIIIFALAFFVILIYGVFFSGNSSHGKTVKYRLVKVTENSEETLFEIDVKNKPRNNKREMVYISAAPKGGKCVIKLGSGKCFTQPFIPTPMSQSQCERQKEKLGIKVCHYVDDYWAGAVKKCGGVNNMPTMAELAFIAGALYKGTPVIGEKKSVENLSYNSENVKNLNLKENNFCLWSGEEFGKLGLSASGRCFFPSYTHFFIDYYRKFDTVSAVCLTESEN